MATIAEQYSEYAATFACNDIPEAVRRRACHLILDSAGVALAASTYDFAHRTVNALAGLGRGDSDVIGMSVKLPLRDAVLANGALIHGIDFDDTHKQGNIHITSSCFPTALAVAAQAEKSGRDVLEAYILGVELATRLAKVARRRFNPAGFHATGLVAAFGCAVIAGKLYGLSREQFTMAQGIVYSMAAGTREYSANSSGSKRLHPGWAGVAGITAAVLARSGITGPRTTYEGRYGLYATHLGMDTNPEDLALATAGLGHGWETMHISVKPFPACQLSIVFIEAAIKTAIAHDLKASDIASVEVVVPPSSVNVICEPVAVRKRPINSYATQFSLQFGLACGLARRKFGLTELQSHGDAELLALAEKVDYRVDPDPACSPHGSGEIAVTLRNGKVLKVRDEPAATGNDLSFSEPSVVSKYWGNARIAVSSSRAEAIRGQILGLETQSHARHVARRLSTD